MVKTVEEKLCNDLWHLDSRALFYLKYQKGNKRIRFRTTSNCYKSIKEVL